MTHLLSADQTREDLRDHLDDLRCCIEDAVARYEQERAESGPVSSRARACLINDFCGENGVKTFDGRAGVEIVKNTDDGRLRAIIFNDHVVVRFKKFNSKLDISFIPTERANAWADQQPLDGFPEATYLNAGYTLDDLGQISQILLVCSLKGRRQWVIDLDDIAGAGAPRLDLTPKTPQVDDRAKVRSIREDRSTGDDA